MAKNNNMEKEIKNDNSPDSQPVTITRGQLDGILAELANLKKGQRFEKPKRVTEHTAYVRYEDDKPVVKYGQVKERKDQSTGKMVAYMNVILAGVKEPKEVEYLAFLNSANQTQVKIISQNREECREVNGVMTAQNPDPHSNKSFQPREIELEVISRKYTATVEVLEGAHKGERFDISTSALNS